MFLVLSLKYGIRTSPTQFFYYLASVITGAITMRSVVQRYQEEADSFDPDADERILYLYSIQYGLQSLLFILHCFGNTDLMPSLVLVFPRNLHLL